MVLMFFFDGSMCVDTYARQAGEGKADGGAKGSLVSRRKGGQPLVRQKNLPFKATEIPY
jgi:hypothetical protein